MAGRETDNFTILDNEQDTDIEPAPQDEWDMEVKQEAEWVKTLPQNSICDFFLNQFKRFFLDSGTFRPQPFQNPVQILAEPIGKALYRRRGSRLS